MCSNTRDELCGCQARCSCARFKVRGREDPMHHSCPHCFNIQLSIYVNKCRVSPWPEIK